MQKTRVAVYGSSLYMAGIAASLKADPTLEVISVDPDSPVGRQCLLEPAVAAVTFDLGEAPPDLAVALLCDRPDLLLIGLDPTTDRMLVLSGYAEQALAAADLVQVVRRQDPNAT